MYVPPSPPPEPFVTTTVVCPIHGLRFDPSMAPGCIRCRASSVPPRPKGGGLRLLALLAVLGALLAATAAIFGDRWFAPPPRPAAPHFTRSELLEESRRVHVEIYSAIWCPSCDAAKTFLWDNQVPYVEHDIDKDKAAREQWEKLNPKKTIPVIDVEGEVLVGSDPHPMVDALLRAADRHLRAARPAAPVE